MNYSSKAKSECFHGYQDTELYFQPGQMVETKETKYIIIQERDVSYRFYLHQHPYVEQLVEKLLRKGTPELQAADTEYEPDEAMPGSIEIDLGSDVILKIPAQSTIALLNDVQTTTSGGITVDLASNMEFKIAGANVVEAVSCDAMRAILVDGMTETPPVDTTFALPQDSKAFIFDDIKIKLKADTWIKLYDGSRAKIHNGTEVLLISGTRVIVPKNTIATLRKCLPRPTLFNNFFDKDYKPDSVLVQWPYPVKDLDFTSSGAYAVYNWELFYHVPITIAIHLSKNQRFAEAQRWFHFLFDPTDDSDGPTPERFWKVRPFQTTDVKKIEKILVNLATGTDEPLRNETINCIYAWMDAPFRPHLIARYRQQAYMYKTVMAYLDNLIAWGDSLFRQDTGESVDEALMVYVLAANILGPRPQAIPKKGTVRSQTYANLRQDLALFGTVICNLEAEIPCDFLPFSKEYASDNDRLATLRSLGKALYFCVPRNDKLLSYWDTVADRLFKIRNSLNIQGVFRQLALFEPPIDPALLARAAAAGLDVGAIVNGLNQPLPLVRFQLLVQKAAEIVQEVKSLGNNLLSAMEKEDNEALTILRARHERAIMEMVEHVKYAQLQEAIKSKEALIQSLALAVQRHSFYEQQLGKKADEIEKAIPELGELDKDSLDKMKFKMQEPKLRLREIEVDIASDVNAQAAKDLSGGKVLSSYEVLEACLLEGAQLSSDVANIMSVISSTLHTIPIVKVYSAFWGVGVKAEPPRFGWTFDSTASAARAIADRLNFEARRASRIDSYARREREWAFQSNLAAGEIMQIFKQLRAAQIREAIAEQELKSHRQQMKHAEEIERFLNEEGTEKTGKKTNKALYAWMKREVKGMYAQCFQFGFDIAKKAERALQHELGNPELSYIQYGYLAGKEGLLAGEKLYLDVKRMEMAFYDLNQREYELTKHVSLLQVNPLALLQLRMTGKCTVTLPEALFDMDGPGHYFRRIKTVAVSIPCVTGPYASVNCKLTLLKSSIRKTQVLSDGVYAREDAEDNRFSDYFGSMESIVTSSAQSDSGMFETNLRDERYLPFENSGVISEWQLELPADPSKNDPQQFDYNTISDVILHFRYTAREGGALLRKGAMDNLKTAIDEAQAAGSARLFSVRHEFPTEWARFQSQTPAPDSRFELAFKLRQEHYPFWSQGRLNNVMRVDILARSSKTSGTSISVYDQPQDGKTENLTKDTLLGNLFVGKFSNGDTGIALPAPYGALKLFFDHNEIEDFWLAITWGN